MGVEVTGLLDEERARTLGNLDVLEELVGDELRVGRHSLHNERAEDLIDRMKIAV